MLRKPTRTERYKRSINTSSQKTSKDETERQDYSTCAHITEHTAQYTAAIATKLNTDIAYVYSTTDEIGKILQNIKNAPYLLLLKKCSCLQPIKYKL